MNAQCFCRTGAGHRILRSPPLPPHCLATAAPLPCHCRPTAVPGARRARATCGPFSSWSCELNPARGPHTGFRVARRRLRAGCVPGAGRGPGARWARAGHAPGACRARVWRGPALRRLPSSHGLHRLPGLQIARLGLKHALVHRRVCFLYGVPLQYVTSTQGRRSMNGRVFQQSGGWIQAAQIWQSCRVTDIGLVGPVFPESIAKGSSARSSWTNLHRVTCAESNTQSQAHKAVHRAKCVEPSA